ncbi:PREDICTED: subtilisin-like protease SBT3.18 [Nelumbo nucifera]|uniref:Subtilisin-like protease SBT3.18 n=1 Tax=Nelumbo nucifera TaxID=4432 RepID=A0A1U7ZZA6_NELNU|nr:PREDICTED: subtilisin-like protease SBT3.18 [Nelumbo nucifera]
MTTSFQWCWGLFLSLSLYSIHSTCTDNVHIIYLGINQAKDPLLTTKSHVQLLSMVFSSEQDAKDAMIYSYKHSFSGFAARLNSTQATALAMMEGVISVFRSKTLRLHTTRSWDFMGLALDHNKAATPLQLAYGDDVVVGIFDTGIWPESESFREEPGMGPVPSWWKGRCVKGEKFVPNKACNRKLIGARYYVEGFEQIYGPLNTSENGEYRSARDYLGHGTHTASTAVGSIVKNASFMGFGEGTGRGGAPRARLAVYKTCWSKELDGRCTEADILAAFDDALHDGVHVISASFGVGPPLAPFFASSADIGSFHATQLGVTVVFSAGNDGPEPSLVENVSPWGICVAASSIDRKFSTRLLLDNNLTILGESFNSKQINGRLVDGINYFFDGSCDFEKWRGRLVSGRLVLCFSTLGPVSSGAAALAVLRANGSGLIFAEPATKQAADVDIIPTIRIDVNQGTRILHYLVQSPKVPMVQLLPGKTIIGRSPAPVVADFSSRGPSSIAPDILKPDISAPGINILAAWSPESPPTLLPIDGRSVSWNFQSGTSMSCPHVAGVVALLRSAHPEWSPAAIKSALMTTAYTRDTSVDKILAGGSMKLADPFDVGAGHINPVKAMDPGLVYDMNTRDYIIFLCSLGYTEAQIQSMVLEPAAAMVDTSCPKGHRTTLTHLNYPSITVPNLQSTVTIKRTVRNVGPEKAIYFVSIVNPDGVKVVVRPRILVFSYCKQEISYHVTLTPMKHSQGRYDFGEIVWSDGCSHHHVRSPLVVRVNTTTVVDGVDSISQY